MKLVNINLVLLALVFLFGCSSSDGDEETVIERLTLSSVSEFSATNDSQSIIINSNLAWTISTSSSWLSITPTSGTNDGVFVINASANAMTDTRTAVVTVAGGDISRSLTITQLGNDNNGELNPNNAPAQNFDLSTWNLSIPVDQGNGTATTISVSQINNNYENDNYFYTAADGGMVFKCPVAGPTTSSNTQYTRVELREMLRGTNTNISTQGVNGNNWVFGTAPTADINAAAAYDGEMIAKLAVNHVTTTGTNSHIGRVVIGQIHANDDEPIRIYYRKLVGNTLGSIYFAHEPTDGNGDEQWYELIGTRSNNASNPTDGIALDEVFTYKIKVVGDILTFTIIREGKPNIVETVNMVNSGYNVGGQYMYFKAGLYHLNNSGDADDYAQLTFYELEKSHTN